MRKKLFVVGITLFFIFILSSGVSAQLPFMSLGVDFIMSDWQLDYIRPIDPGELEKGDYRITPIIARINSIDKKDHFFNNTETYDNDNNTMAYILALDTGLSDNLTLHSKFAYQPWEKYSFNNRENENRNTLFDLFLNYELKEDKQIFFGYNRIFEKDKEYDNLNKLKFEEEETTNIYYLGFEFRGSFLGKNN